MKCLFRSIYLEPGQHTYVEVFAVVDAYIIVDVHELYGQRIDIEIIRPDESLGLPKTRIVEYHYGFVAKMTGTCKIRLDNTFDTFYPKRVRIAVAVNDPLEPETPTLIFPRMMTKTKANTQTDTEREWKGAFVIPIIVSIIAGVFWLLMVLVVFRFEKK